MGPTPSTRRRRWLLRVMLILAVGAALLAWLVREPGWYAPPDVKDAKVAELAGQVEYNLVQQAHQIRPGQERWTRRVHDDQVNAWLAARLREWVVNQGGQWPAGVGAPQVLFQPGCISIAVPVGEGGSLGILKRTVVARFTPTVNNGRLHVKLDRVALGRLALPGEPVTALLDRLNAAMPGLVDQPELQAVIAALTGTDDLEPVMELSDGRRLELVDLKIADGSLDFAVRTLPASR